MGDEQNHVVRGSTQVWYSLIQKKETKKKTKQTRPHLWGGKAWYQPFAHAQNNIILIFKYI